MNRGRPCCTLGLIWLAFLPISLGCRSESSPGVSKPETTDSTPTVAEQVPPSDSAPTGSPLRPKFSDPREPLVTFYQTTFSCSEEDKRQIARFVKAYWPCQEDCVRRIQELHCEADLVSRQEKALLAATIDGTLSTDVAELYKRTTDLRAVDALLPELKLPSTGTIDDEGKTYEAQRSVLLSRREDEPWMAAPLLRRAVFGTVSNQDILRLLQMIAALGKEESSLPVKKGGFEKLVSELRKAGISVQTCSEVTAPPPPADSYPSLQRSIKMMDARHDLPPSCIDLFSTYKPKSNDSLRAQLTEVKAYFERRAGDLVKKEAMLLEGLRQ